MIIFMIMAFIQGLTEFLPISSSGHLLFFQSLFHIKEMNLAIDVFLHIATLLVILVYYYNDIKKLIREFIISPFQLKNPYTRLVYLIILANIPTALLGLIIKEKLGFVFENVNILFFTWMITAFLLFISDKVKNLKTSIPTITPIQSLLIGLAQGIAIFPGISRSGATIITALFLGIKREDSTRFCFLVGLPAMLGATVLEFHDISQLNFSLLYLVIIFIITFLTGLIAIKFLIQIVNKGKLKYFGYYLIFITFILLIKVILIK